MLYAVRHVTRYTYSHSISENIMEIRKHPLSDQRQRCLNFTLTLDPPVRIFRYSDHLGNLVHHFDVPWQHSELTVIGESVVEVLPPDAEAPALSWQALAERLEHHDLYDMLQPSELVHPGPELAALADELNLAKDKFATPRELAEAACSGLSRCLSYEKDATDVDTPIQEVLKHRRGVCQDFAHVLLGLLRDLRIPCRYISGYRLRGESASHAWIEAYVLDGERPWLALDPSRGEAADESYITNCVGRDYADCPPTRGVYRGEARGALEYAVQVRRAEEPVRDDRFVSLGAPTRSTPG